jgi:hypothetical protein
MAQVSGKVNQIKSKPTQYGEMFDVVINGESYGMGKFAPRGINPGDYVSLEFEQKGNFRNVVKGSLRKDETPRDVATPSVGPSAASPAPYNAGRAPYVPFDERQEMISKQSALNTALTFCKLASDNQAVPMPKGVKEADKLGLLYQWVLDTAGTLYNLSTGRDWAMPETSASTIEKPAVKAPAKAKAVETEDTGYSEYGE